MTGSAKKRIDSLQALRAFAFLGIFFIHSDFFIQWSSLGVSVFFVLSGFLMAHRYGDDDLDTSVKGNLLFSIERIKKLYPLHIITMIVMIIPAVEIIIRNGSQLRSYAALLVKLVLNVLLVEIWVPNYNIYFSLNSSAWFLAAMMFLYFLFPWIKKCLAKLSLIKLNILCLVILAAETAACMVFILVLGEEHQLYSWFMYYLPAFRIGEFVVGCALGRMIRDGKISGVGTVGMTVYEAVALVLTIVLYRWYRTEHSRLIVRSYCNWTTFFIPISAVWVLLFATNKGWLTKILTNRLTVFIGNISGYAYLIHYVLTKIVKMKLTDNDIVLDLKERIVLVIVEFAVTIALSVLYGRVNERIAVRSKKKSGINGAGELTEIQ